MEAGDDLVDNYAKLVKDLALVIAMATTQHQAECGSDIALVCLGPLDDLGVACAVFYGFTRRIMRRALTYSASWAVLIF